MDHTNRSNLALQGRYYFLVREGQDCKMRWSQNTNKRRREIVRLKVGDFAQQGRIRSTDCHVVPPRNDKPHITSRTVSPRNDHYHCNFVRASATK